MEEFARPIARAIIENNELKILERLALETVQCGTQVSQAIERWEKNGDFRSVSVQESLRSIVANEAVQRHTSQGNRAAHCSNQTARPAADDFRELQSCAHR